MSQTPPPVLDPDDEAGRTRPHSSAQNFNINTYVQGHGSTGGLASGNGHVENTSVPKDGGIRPALIGLIGVIIAAVIGAVALIWVNVDDDKDKGASSTPSTNVRLPPVVPPVSTPLPATQATIHNTWDVNSKTNLGVSTYEGPSNKFTKSAGLAEGTTIGIVCQRRAGQVIEDAPYAGRLPSSPVWFKMDGPPGVSRWVPGLYVDIINTPQAANIPECPQ